MRNAGGPQRPVWDEADAPQQWQRQKADEHLRLLSGLYHVSGLVQAFGCVALIVYFAAFANFAGAAVKGRPDADATTALTLGFLGVGGLALFYSVATTTLTLYAGYCLTTRQNRALIQVAAGLNCVWVPLGTALGVITFVFLADPAVRERFAPIETARANRMNR